MKTKKQEIIEWLENPARTAEAGTALYKKHGVNMNLMRFIQNVGDQKKVMGMLETQLKLLVGISVLPKSGSAPVQVKKQAKPKVTKTSVEKLIELQKANELKDPYPDKEKRPDELKVIYALKDEFYVNARNLSSILVAKGDTMEQFHEDSKEYNAIKDERKEMAKQLIGLYNKINEYWKKIDYFKANGELPDAEELEPTPDIKADTDNQAQLDKRWRTLGTYISKEKKKKEPRHERLQQLVGESNAIAARLNEMTGEETYKMRDEFVVQPEKEG